MHYYIIIIIIIIIMTGIGGAVHHCYCRLSLVATGVADESWQEQWVVASGGGGDVEREGKRDK